MKKLLQFPLMTGMLLFSIASLKAQTPGLSFTIAVNKTSYAAGDPVKCTLTLKNTSGKDLVINKRFLVNNPAGPHEISFQLIGPDLKPLSFMLKIDASFTTSDYRVLHTGQSEIQNYTLGNGYD